MLKTDETGNADLTIRHLGIDDISQVHALFEREFRTLEYGFMAFRTIEEFAAILQDVSGGASVGAFHDGKLVGYSLAQMVFCTSMADVLFLRNFELANQKIWFSKGAVIDRQYRGFQLVTRLTEAKSVVMREKCPTHMLGLVAVANIPSLAAIFRGGFWVVDFEEDEYCLNFLFYEGPLNENRRTTGMRLIDCRDIEYLSAAFASGWVGTGLQFDEPSGRNLVELTRPEPFVGQ